MFRGCGFVCTGPRVSETQLQVLIRESQPQAVPYAAASSDPTLTEEAVTDQVDQGVEQGLATAATTKIADIAYSHSSQPDASSQLIQQDTSAVLPLAGPTDVEQQDHPGLNVQEASQVVQLNTACLCCDGLITHCVYLVGIKAKIIYLWAGGRQRSVLLNFIAWGIEALATCCFALSGQHMCISDGPQCNQNARALIFGQPKAEQHPPSWHKQGADICWNQCDCP